MAVFAIVALALLAYFSAFVNSALSFSLQRLRHPAIQIHHCALHQPRFRRKHISRQVGDIFRHTHAHDIRLARHFPCGCFQIAAMLCRFLLE